jgi:hypothetical protein
MVDVAEETELGVTPPLVVSALFDCIQNIILTINQDNHIIVIANTTHFNTCFAFVIHDSSLEKNII